MEEKKPKYLAFISYRHENKAWAEALQKTLEDYHLPIWIRDERPDLPETLRPVFRDETDLPAGGILDERIKEALRSSKKLIVIAAPEIVDSNWPNQEIEYFANLDVSEDNPFGRINDIIPVIYDGKPFSEVPKQECYPEALRRIILEKKDLYGIDIKALGSEIALSKIVAALLDVDPDTLWQRYRRAHKKKVLRACLIEALVGCLLVSFAWEGIRKGFELIIQKDLQVAATASALVKEGDSFMARRVLLEAIPRGKVRNLSKEPELEWALFDAMSADEGLIHVTEPISEMMLMDSTTLVSLSVSSALRTAYLREWDLMTGAPIRAMEYEFSLGGDRDISFLFSPDRKHILTDDGIILVTDSFSPVYELKDVKRKLSGVAFSPNGALIAGCDDRILGLWDESTGARLSIPKIQFSFERLTFSHDTIVFSPDGRYLAASPLQEGVGVLDLDGMHVVALLPAGDSVRIRSTGKVPRKTVFASEQVLSFSDDARRLCTRGRDGSVHLWDISAGVLLSTYDNNIDNSEDIGQVYELVDKYTIKVHLPRLHDSPIMIHPPVVQKPQISDWDGLVETVSPDGRRKASVDYDNRVLTISDVATGNVLSVADTLESIGILEFSPDGNIILAYGRDEDIRLYDAHSGKLYSEWNHYEGCAPVFSPKRRLLAAADFHDHLYVWDYKGNEVAAVSIDKIDGIFDYLFSPDGKSLAIIGNDGNVLIWDLISDEFVPLTGLLTDFCENVCFSPDSHYITGFTNDGILGIWLASNGKLLHKQGFPFKTGASVCFSEDGSSIIASSWDGETWKWDLPDFNGLAKDLWKSYGSFKLSSEEKRKLLP